MYAEDAPLWQRYEQACDFLEDDLDSGYVRVLQEMIAAGWSNAELGAAVRELLGGWCRAAHRGRPGGRAPPRAARPVHRRGAGHPGRLRLLRLGGAAAARLRPGGAADPLGAATRRRADPTARGRSGRTDDAGMPADLVTATSSATGSRSTTRSTARASRRCCCCRPGRSSTRGTGRCRSPTWRGIAGCSPSTGAATAAPTARPSPRRTAEPEFAADALAVMDATGTDRAVMVGVVDGRAPGAAAGRDPSRAGRRRSCSSARRCPGGGEPRGRRTVYSFDRRARHRRGLGQVQPPLLARATTRSYLEFFFVADVHRAALHQADRGHRRLGPGDRPRDADRSPSSAPRHCEPERRLRELAARGCAARSWSSTATRTRIRP